MMVLSSKCGPVCYMETLAQSPAHPTLRVRGERVGELNPNRAQLRFPYSVGVEETQLGPIRAQLSHAFSPTRRTGGMETAV